MNGLLNEKNERENKSNHISAIRTIRFLLWIPALCRLCMARSFLSSNLPNSKMKIDWDDFNVKADYVIETVVKPQVEKYELSKQLNIYKMENKLNTGAIFKNTNKKAENHPDYKGKVNINGKEMEIALWVKQGKAGSFFSAAFSEPYVAPDKMEQVPVSKAMDDDLPF